MATQLSSFSTRIIGAVKAELSRRDLDGKDLVEPLGIGRNAVYSRLRGETAFTTEDLARIEESLGITVDTILTSAALQKAVA
jgi:plasmid maintenance system antidote protein VapI